MRNHDTTTVDTDKTKESVWQNEQETILAIGEMSEEEVQAHLHMLLAGKVATDDQKEHYE